MSVENHKDQPENNQNDTSSFLDDLKNQLGQTASPEQKKPENDKQTLEDELSAMLSTEFDAPEKLDEEHDFSTQSLMDAAVLEGPETESDDGLLEEVLEQLKTQTASDHEMMNFAETDNDIKRKQQIQQELANLITANSQNETQSEEDRKKLDDLLLQLERQSVQDEWVPESITNVSEQEAKSQSTNSPYVDDDITEPVRMRSDASEEASREPNKDDALKGVEDNSEGFSKEEDRQASKDDDPEVSSPLEPLETEQSIELAITTSILHKDVAGTEIELERLIERDQISAVIIVKMNKTWASAGKLSIKDINDIEDILIQSKKARKKIDMARFLKLGIHQQKYLLYAVSISNAYVFCTINSTSNPLSLIRKQTLEIANKLTIPDDPEAELMMEESALEETLEMKKEDESVPSATEEEAKHTTLDELLAEESLGEDSPQDEEEFEEWVYEVMEEEEPSELPGSPSEYLLKPESKPKPETDVEIKEEAEIHPPLAEQVESEEPTLGSEEAEGEGITNETERPPTDENDQIIEAPFEPMPASAPDQSVETDKKLPAKPTPQLPKAGYGRYKNEKYIQKEPQRSKEHQELSQKLHMIYKFRSEDGSEKVSERIAYEADLLPSEGELPQWEPTSVDTLSDIRNKLRNQKEPPKKLFKQSPVDTTAEPEEIQMGPVEVEQADFKDEQSEVDPTIHKADDIVKQETVSKEEESVKPLETLFAEEIEIKPEESQDEILPPETLSDLKPYDAEGLEVDFQKDIDAVLHDIMQDLQEEGEDLESQEADLEPLSTRYDDISDLKEEKELDENDVVIIDENLDFLKTLADFKPTLDGSEDDKDATEFFEEYIEEAGEPIEFQVSSTPLPTNIEPDDSSKAAEDETDEIASGFLQLDSDVDTSEMLKIMREKLDGSEDLSPSALLTPNLEDDFSKTIISLQDKDQVEADEDTEELADAGSDTFEETKLTTERTADEALDIGVEEQVDKDSDPLVDEFVAAQFPSDVEDNIDQFPEFDEDDLQESFTQETAPEEIDLQQIVSEVLAEQHEEIVDEETSSVDAQEDLQPDLQETDIAPVEQVAEEEELHIQETLPPTVIDDLLGEDNADSLGIEDLLPWEKEGEREEDDIEITPTPRSLLDEDHSADVLIDLLAKTSLEPVQLGFDQPIYTCILVPELSEFSLNNKISSRIKEWLPKLSRVYGWEFENVFIQPTYLQWTVRVPSGTSQGSIVRRIRQQTSLRIFEEFPELKKLSLSGNFWAKGYLVVSGSNPPPAEFLDDFIQKNRRPSGIMGT